jgi:5'-nucleotidase
MPADLIGLFDMDGTLFDYDGQLRKDLETLMSPNETMPDNIFDESIPWIKARMHLIKSQPGWWRELPKFQLGWDVYEIAVELGFCIDILTKGPRSKPQAWAEKVECIMRHFGDEVVPNIVGKTKKRYYGSFLCDDYPPYVEDWLKHRPRGLAIMPAHDYNKNFTHKNVIRYDGTNLNQVREALLIVSTRQAGEQLVLP